MKLHVGKFILPLLCGVAAAQFNPNAVTPPLTGNNSYTSGLESALASVQAQIAGEPRPAIQLSGQNALAVVGYVNGGRPCNPVTPRQESPKNPCDFDNYHILNAFTDALVRAGNQSMDINLEVGPLASSAQYSGSLPNDCANYGFNCATMDVYDSLIAHAQSVGIKVRLAPAPSTFTNKACNLVGTAAGGNSGVAAVIGCYGPLYEAAAQRWGSAIDSITVIHEPYGAWVGNTAYTWQSATAPGNVPVAWNVGVGTDQNLRQFVAAMASHVRKGSSAISVGAAVGSGLCNAKEGAAWSDWLSAMSGSGSYPFKLDYLAVDVYPNTWDAADYNCPGKCASGVAKGALPLVSGWVAAAKAAGVTNLRINESNRPVWVPQGMAAEGANGFLNNADITWENDGLDVAWQSVFASWAAVTGFRSVSMYATQIWVWYETNSPSGTDYMLSMLPHIGSTSLSGQNWATLGGGH